VQNSVITSPDGQEWLGCTKCKMLKPNSKFMARERKNGKKDRVCKKCHSLDVLTKTNLGSDVLKQLKYDWNSRDGLIEHLQKYRKKTRNKLSKQHQELRREIITYYGGDPPKCAICECDLYEVLSVDHLFNNGANHRRQVGSNIYASIKKDNFPQEFQVLCRNCNWLKNLATRKYKKIQE